VRDNRREKLEMLPLLQDEAQWEASCVK
jgi:hypothetical protein